MDPKIVILDFGSQYTQLIARRIRESHVFSEVVSCRISLTELLEKKPSGIILSGGPASVYEKEAPLCDKKIFSLGIPVLGICYGMQLMTHLLGGKVEQSLRREYGRADIVISPSDLFESVGVGIPVWMSHGDQIVRLPSGFEVIAKTENSEAAAIRARKRSLYGLQFHPEVAHTPEGLRILQNFIYSICGCKPTWTMGAFVKEAQHQIREEVGDGTVIAAMSGGVDSSVASVLVGQVIGKKLTCVFVDNGLLRKNEAKTVVETLRKKLNLNIRLVNAQDQFLNKLQNIKDPEKKRKIIGKEFISVFEQEAKKIRGRNADCECSFLLQGTLYPDVIESVSYKGPSATIKTHHNVGGLPARMRLALIEPLRLLFKDEVRKLGAELGIPETILNRHPFPGPGLAVRILGAVTKERLAILREADAIVEEEIRAANLYHALWQAFAVYLPLRTVGVMGDERTYHDAIAIRAVTSVDGMTADWAEIPHGVLQIISTRITNEVKGINRVVYDISSKPPSTIEWE
ncbi:MAG: glutamine-hydrolyzing GMP synthase [Nitrospirae bacterium]|nr:glutamine-hydrolyzing GMP synthase [Candidatus Troglogloeales bacterium]